MEERNELICENCGCVIEDEYEMREVNGRYYCDDCFQENFIVCDECGEIIDINNDWYECVNGYYYCQYCFSDKFGYCDRCGDIVPIDDLIHIEDTDENVCEYCADNHYYRCEDCGDWYSEGAVEYCDEDDAYYCENCMPDHESFIHSYHASHDDYVKFFGGEDDGQTLFMGLELEIDGGDFANKTAEEMYNVMPDGFITMEHDGSLSNEGFENITQPATLEYHMSIIDDYKAMFKTAISNGYRSHDAGSCGLHVHINRSYFEDREEECIAKLLYLTEKFWGNLVKFSRRTESQLDRWAASYDETPQQVIDKMKNRDLDRYHAVNLTNYSTIEFRIFRGTLKLSTFIATLQFVDTIARYCKEKTIEELQNLNFEDLLITEEMKAYWETVKNK